MPETWARSGWVCAEPVKGRRVNQGAAHTVRYVIMAELAGAPSTKCSTWQRFSLARPYSKFFSVFKDRVTGNAPRAFPSSARLAFQVLLMNEAEGALFKSVVLSPGYPL